MVKRIFAISFIYVCTVIAWLFLTGTMMVFAKNGNGTNSNVKTGFPPPINPGAGSARE